MASTAIDTLRFARKLKQAGLPDEQAEAMAVELGEELTEYLTTKPDLEVLRAHMLLLKWMIGFNLVFSAIILWRLFNMHLLDFF